MEGNKQLPVLAKMLVFQLYIVFGAGVMAKNLRPTMIIVFQLPARTTTENQQSGPAIN